MAQESQSNGERIADRFSPARHAFLGQARLAEAEAAEPADGGEEAGKLARMVSALLCGFIPAANDAHARDAQALIASALQPVIEKYGWRIETLPPEIRLLLETGPLLLQSGKLLGRQSAAQTPAHATAPNSEDRQGANGRRKSERRNDAADRRAAQAQNTIRPYRWNQFKP
ncbi:MAG: hypothetical protein HY777_05795 [Betaproteobacteria bacterium]|nr:hypothetical protein [Betaproteobacteria bacterium]